MSGGGFTSPFAANSNPFGPPSADSRRAPDNAGSMQQVIEEDENDIVSSPTSPFALKSGAVGGPSRALFPADSSSDFSQNFGRSPPPGEYPAQYNFGRRTSVSAESLKPVTDSYDNWSPPVHQKSAEQLERLKAAIQGNFLFSHLDEEQSAQILGALMEKPIPTKGIKVITQGDSGDFFYVVEKGSFDAYVNSSGTLQSGPEGLGTKVDTIAAGGSFGELALMYNAPRAATVISAEPACTLWALDRLTFRRILMESTFARRRMYESFLEEVPLLATLTPYERSKIADALETQKFAAGATIIREGDLGHSFYLVESGEATVYKSGTESPVKHYQKGDFFGELALLNDAPRAATIVAKTDIKVATLGKSAFQRLLGPVEGIMRRTRYEGVKTGVEDLDPLQTS
ncbi:cAMP-dependent protein kinase regulator [Sporothrix brasiliensis 5110]|uniref:cAMP-dependent protein kinase regulatory subunit n=1 Tax=Sporothrix brasiliensis 5110 TaxID=1398154 RepID=A0A0C2EP88_9PEZI|nr:cAMP-dependent protein kinase regulator [Sporothrix brasiliensis 5110]KIH88009.1 cAMP-dependent protein kinase regulator [Sporothrix brasiliensis 5110]